MSNLGLATAGASCESASCHDVEFPPASAIDGKPSTYWMTTGMFPQEIVIKLGRSSTVRRVQVSGMNREPA
jgi:heat shock protein beta-11